jgi:histidinol dehydrogenase
MKVFHYKNFDINKIRENIDLKKIESDVLNIIEKVKIERDKALNYFALKFDGTDLEKVGILEKEENFEKAYKFLLKKDKKFIEAINISIKRISEFHKRQKEKDFIIVSNENGSEILGQLVKPIERVLIYIPGGKAIYISSIIMNVIPAQIAGVKNIYLTFPVKWNMNVPAEILAVLYILNEKKLYKVGGAHAIASFAFGTNKIPKVDKITGPGNIYVSLAKKLLFGIVDIDMIAGPTEVVIIADENSNPYFVAADLLAQAEHDEMALPVLISNSKNLIKNVENYINKLLSNNKNKIAEISIKKNFVAILTDTIERAFEISNEIAPEHLQIMLSSPLNYLPYVKNAGAVFLGEYSPTCAGDYLAGPNHTLPTMGSAKFFSQLSVQNFTKKIGFVHFSKEKFENLANPIIKLAKTEKLNFHALSAKVRINE